MLSRRIRQLKPCLYASAALLIPLIVMGAVWKGVPGAVGAVAGLVLVAVSFIVGWYAIAAVETWDTRLVLPAGFMAFTGKVIVFSAVFLLASRTGWTGMQPMAAGAALSLVVWLVVLMLWAARTRLPYVEPKNHEE